MECIHLSTHILPEDRTRRIEEIKNGDGKKLIVTTQLIEAGVDIDADIIFRDFAPLDSIIQTAGRCNREAHTKRGKVKVILLKDETGANLCSYIYGKTLLDITRKIVEGAKSQSEKRFNLQAANQYFRLCRTRGADEEAVFDNVKNLMFLHFLGLQKILFGIPLIVATIFGFVLINVLETQWWKWRKTIE